MSDILGTDFLGFHYSKAIKTLTITSLINDSGFGGQNLLLFEPFLFTMKI